MKKNCLTKITLTTAALVAAASCLALFACRETPEERPAEEPVSSIVWQELTFNSAAYGPLNYGLYLPDAYSETGDPLPLVTYMPDATYADATIAKVEEGQMPVNWVTEEKMATNPTVFLIFASNANWQQVNEVIDSVCENYNIDTDRLYLTGQSAGGILDWSLNYQFPTKFAATLYVGCQPGGEVHDETYDEILASELFCNQKFVYIGSRLDEKSSAGQDDVEQILLDNEIAYGKLYGLDHQGGEALEAAVQAVLDEGLDHNFFGFTQVADGGSNLEHMKSFLFAYQIDALFYWLLAQ